MTTAMKEILEVEQRQARLDVAKFTAQERAILTGLRQGPLAAREIRNRFCPGMSLGGLYLMLDRMVGRGQLVSWMGEPVPERGGMRPKIYALAFKEEDAKDDDRATPWFIRDPWLLATIIFTVACLGLAGLAWTNL